MSGVVAGTVDLGNISTIVFDLDGVLYVDTDPVPGAGETLAALDESFQLLYATNNSTRTVATIVEHIADRTGFVPDPSAIATSGLATARALDGVASSAFVVGEQGLIDTLDEHGIRVVARWQDADAVVVGLDRGLNYQRLAEATLAVRAGAAFYATNDDATYPMPQGLYPGGGAMVAALQTATDVVPIVCGKPHAPMRDLIEGIASSHAILMVGDRLETDIAFGKASDWSTALVLTGVVDDPTEVVSGSEPDVILDSVAGLVDLLA